jgi:hypothetical protein
MSDAVYREIFLDPIRTCKKYKPKFGQSGKDRDVTLPAFKQLYGADSFYHWIGLDSDLMYAAHKAAGGMTSIYRQIGVGCERLFKRIILDTVEYSDHSFASWSYETTKTVIKNNQPKLEKRILTLDGRLEFKEIGNPQIHAKLMEWVSEYCRRIDANIPDNGVVFEVRQGYKSKDSKRQNADIENASTAWAKGYLPLFAIFSAQIDVDNMNRYINSRAGVLIGQSIDDPYISLFSFVKEILGYDLAGFFERNSAELRNEVNEVLDVLLSAK